MYRFIDLFAGVGGFHLAFNSENCVFASEIDINARETYKLNFPDTVLEGDITEIDEKIFRNMIYFVQDSHASLFL